MANTLKSGGFDQLDHAILRELQHDGRMSVTDLGRRVHLSPPAVYQRIKRLERAGVIQRYVALVDRTAAGYDVLCYIKLSLQPHTRERWAAFQAAIDALPAVQECYHIAGSFDILLKVVARDHKALERFVADQLMTLDGVERIETNIVLNEMKVTTQLALG